MFCRLTCFPYNFDIYCEKHNDRKTPLGQDVVNKMLSPVTNKNCNVAIFDNYFTSYQVMSDIANIGIRACGTVRENRSDQCSLGSNKEIQKQSRGTYDYRSDGTVMCIKWNDNRVVAVASNY